MQVIITNLSITVRDDAEAEELINKLDRLLTAFDPNETWSYHFEFEE